MDISFICSTLVLLLFSHSIPTNALHNLNGRVALRRSNNSVVIENGMLQLTLSNPGGIVTGIKYNGINNLLDVNNTDLRGGSWDVDWSEEGTAKTSGIFQTIKGTSFKVIVETEEQVEVSFIRKWTPNVQGKHVPLFIDIRYIVLQNVSGFHSYGIFEHQKDMPGFSINTARIAFMLNKDKFRYMAIADDKQRFMPRADDRLPQRGQPLEYKEAVLLVDPELPQFKGEVDDKYEYSLENKDNRVHGWISFDPPVGFWQIAPSNEYRAGGPFKQDLTSHVGPITLAIFLTSHYAGEDLLVQFKRGEEWKKVVGPVFIYLNSPSNGEKPLSLWDDAKKQLAKEVSAWPYSFPASEDFPASDQRGTVRGKLLVKDRYISKNNIPGKGSFVGLAAPGVAGSWQRENKGYQFWARTDDQGNFAIRNIRPGDYNLYATVPGFIGDYRRDDIISIPAGQATNRNLGNLVYEPPRDGPTLWEIGIPDRSASEFYVPDPNPKYVNKLYVNHTEKYRQYGLWERYADLYPDKDLVYTVGVSNYKKDWFFAHVTRKVEDKIYNATTWKIKFKLENVVHAGNYKLRLALASAQNSDLQVRVNDPVAPNPVFSTGAIGGDNAIARHGIHGIYWLFNVTVPGGQLVRGINTIFLTQAKHSSPFQGIMYDYIRLEAPPLSATSDLRLNI